MAKLPIVASTVLLCIAAMVQLSQGAIIAKQPKTVCYYESWIHWKTGDGKMDIEDIDSKLCSHIVYAYFGIYSTSHELKFMDPYLEKDLHDLNKFVQAKGRAKAMIAIGGAVNSDQFAIVAANEQYLESFVDSVVKLLEQYQFDGVVIDWYYLQPRNVSDFAKLLRKLAQKFESNQLSLGITIAEPDIYAGAVANFQYVDFIGIVDFVNVLTFDYASLTNGFVGDSSPLDNQLWTLSNLVKQGFPREKLLMGEPFYARMWKLDKGNFYAYMSTGPNTLLKYNELCMMMKSSPDLFRISRNENLSVRAINVHTNEWISYDDPQLLAYKASNITAEGYGGIAVFALANDDYRGICGERYPMLRAIAQGYTREQQQESTTLAAKTTTFAPRSSNQAFACPSELTFLNTFNCYQHVECVKGELGAFEFTIMSCEPHQFWDDKRQMCTETKPASCNN